MVGCCDLVTMVGLFAISQLFMRRSILPSACIKILVLPPPRSEHTDFFSHNFTLFSFPILTKAHLTLPQTTTHNTAIMSKNWTKETFTLNTVSHHLSNQGQHHN
jgi:hypothetical protein